MARAIKFTEDFGRRKKGKKLVGGFKKGETWPTCSNQLAQKLVNHRKVAVFVEEKAGDKIKQSMVIPTLAIKEAEVKASEVVKTAEEKAAEIIKEAEEKAAATIKAAEDLAK